MQASGLVDGVSRSEAARLVIRASGLLGVRERHSSLATPVSMGGAPHARGERPCRAEPRREAEARTLASERLLIAF